MLDRKVRAIPTYPLGTGQRLLDVIPVIWFSLPTEIARTILI